MLMLLLPVTTARTSPLTGSTPTATTAATTTPTTATTATATTPTAATTAATNTSTPTTTPSATTATSTASTTPTTTSTGATPTTLASLALATAAPPTRSRRSRDLLSTKEVNSSSRIERGGKGGGGTPLKEGSARSATSSTYSNYASLRCKEVLREQVDSEVHGGRAARGKQCGATGRAGWLAAQQGGAMDRAGQRDGQGRALRAG
ncbi:unnamed protein product [Closterium sp. NIES-54]